MWQGMRVTTSHLDFLFEFKYYLLSISHLHKGSFTREEFVFNSKTLA